MRVFLIFVVIGWVLIGSISTSVSAQESGSKKMIFGEGINSCGSWTQSQQTKSIYQGLSAQWVAGFLSGMNMQADVPNFLSGTDFNGVMGWMNNYCSANPLTSIADAAVALKDHLRSRVRN
jgi:hypothetical protein